MNAIAINVMTVAMTIIIMIAMMIVMRMSIAVL
jgi:hypothetical protein